VLAFPLLTGCHSLIVVNIGIGNKAAAALDTPMSARAYCLALLAPDIDIRGHRKLPNVSADQQDFCSDVLKQTEPKK
jgi:hypothetical protein